MPQSATSTSAFRPAAGRRPILNTDTSTRASNDVAEAPVDAPVTTPVARTDGSAFVPARRKPNLGAVSEPSASEPAGPSASAALVKRDRPVLLFNDQCEVCKVLSAWVKREDAEGKDLIDERPIGNDPAALAALDPRLDIWEVYKEIHVLLPDGTIKKGGEAIAEVLKRLPSTRWFAGVFDLGVGDFKPLQSALNVAYVVLDAIRPALGCKSCGGGPVAWWALPIKWTADLVKKLRGAEVPAPAQP